MAVVAAAAWAEPGAGEAGALAMAVARGTKTAAEVAAEVAKAMVEEAAVAERAGLAGWDLVAAARGAADAAAEVAAGCGLAPAGTAGCLEVADGERAVVAAA